MGGQCSECSFRFALAAAIESNEAVLHRSVLFISWLKRKITCGQSIGAYMDWAPQTPPCFTQFGSHTEGRRIMYSWKKERNNCILNSDASHRLDSTKLQRINYSLYLKKKDLKCCLCESACVHAHMCIRKCVSIQSAGSRATATLQTASKRRPFKFWTVRTGNKRLEMWPKKPNHLGFDTWHTITPFRVSDQDDYFFHYFHSTVAFSLLVSPPKCIMGG